jgi:hypothetical protein
MQHDSIFRIYSMTKPIVSVAVMMLVEEGAIALEDPVTKENFTQVTVKYGFFGNCEQSQQIVSRITQNLRR